jgi:hypothetical protein
MASCPTRPPIGAGGSVRHPAGTAAVGFAVAGVVAPAGGPPVEPGPAVVAGPGRPPAAPLPGAPVPADAVADEEDEDEAPAGAEPLEAAADAPDGPEDADAAAVAADSAWARVSPVGAATAPPAWWRGRPPEPAPGCNATKAPPVATTVTEAASMASRARRGADIGRVLLRHPGPSLPEREDQANPDALESTSISDSSSIPSHQ